MDGLAAAPHGQPPALGKTQGQAGDATTASAITVLALFGAGIRNSWNLVVQMALSRRP